MSKGNGSNGSAGNGRVPAFPVYLFDVDGTLLDSAEDICGAIIGALEGTGCRPVSLAELTPYIGLHLIETFADLLPDAPPEHIDALVQKYRAIYPARGHKSTRVYPGVREALPLLPGRKSTATTKSTTTTRAILELFGLAEHFHHVQGTDGFPHKPAPDVIYRTFEAFNVRPEDVLFIGDSPADMEAGRRAGVKVAAVTYGYGKREALARWEPDYWVNDLRDLVP